ncbi:hypothetical protein H0H92_005009 [Tricholoma furcatifolium]|nr:hypothetical protein H0H92_005009 [Tricholoma furcatifolium]
MLEDRISQVQSRIRQLENKEEPAVIPLHIPYSNHSPTRLSFQSPPPRLNPQSSPFSHPVVSSSTSHSSRSSSRSHSGSPPPSPEPPANIQLLFSHPHRIIQGIQAEVLLSYYYLKHGKVLGGHYHANAAISLSLSAGLHRIRTSQPSSPSGPLSSPTQTLSPLPKPIDDTEEGERINSFWTVLVLNNTWIAIQESHFMFHDLQAIGVDTPWPMDTFEYQLKLLPSASSGTIQSFLNSTNIEGYSVMALHAKAAVLLEQATVYASTPDELQLAVSSTASMPDFGQLEAIIEQFKSQLPMIERMDVTPSEADTLMIMQMMAHTATIKLHSPQVEKGEMRSRQLVLNAAQEIAVLTNSMRPDSSIRVDPIVGVLWTAACEVFIHELLGANSVVPGNDQQWSSWLHSILSQMNTFAINNVFITFLLNRLRKNYPGVLTMW